MCGKNVFRILYVYYKVEESSAHRICYMYTFGLCMQLYIVYLYTYDEIFFRTYKMRSIFSIALMKQRCLPDKGTML